MIISVAFSFFHLKTYLKIFCECSNLSKNSCKIKYKTVKYSLEFWYYYSFGVIEKHLMSTRDDLADNTCFIILESVN